VREARAIQDSTHSEEKQAIQNVKSHEEILTLLKEIDELEESIKYPEFIDVTPDTYVDKSSRQNQRSDELSLPSAEDIKQKHKKPPKLKEIKAKWHFFSKKQLDEELENNEMLEISEFPQKIQNLEKPIKSTFTLHIDQQGNLTGLNIKKPKVKKERDFKSIFKIFKKKNASKEIDSNETEKQGIKKKLKNITSKLKRKSSKEGEESKLSKHIGKIKGIFSKK
jgi:hypothetical protein